MVGGQLEQMILEVFTNINDSMIHFARERNSSLQMQMMKFSLSSSERLWIFLLHTIIRTHYTIKVHLTVLEVETTNTVPPFILSWGQFYLRKLLLLRHCCQNKTILRKLKPLSTTTFPSHLTRHLFQAQSGIQYSSSFQWLRFLK